MIDTQQVVSAGIIIPQVIAYIGVATQINTRASNKELEDVKSDLKEQRNELKELREEFKTDVKSLEKMIEDLFNKLEFKMETNVKKSRLLFKHRGIMEETSALVNVGQTYGELREVSYAVYPSAVSKQKRASRKIVSF